MDEVFRAADVNGNGRIGYGGTPIPFLGRSCQRLSHRIRQGMPYYLSDLVFFTSKPSLRSCLWEVNLPAFPKLANDVFVLTGLPDDLVGAVGLD